MNFAERTYTLNYTNRPPIKPEGGVYRIMESTLTPHDAWIGPLDAVEAPTTDLKSYENYRFQLGSFECPSATKEQHYNHISLGFMWPFFHQLDVEIDRLLNRITPEGSDKAAQLAQSYEGYKSFLDHSNTAFNGYDATGKVAIIHDFPGIGVRSESAAANAFFLHVPFPEADWIDNLMIGDTKFVDTPMFTDMMTKLTAYEFVGFQTRKDCERFIELLSRHAPDFQMALENHVTAFGNNFLTDRVTVGIDPNYAGNQARNAVYIPRMEDLVERLQGKDVILSVSRNDYTKGTRELAETIDTYFQAHPEEIGQTAFVVARLPSRQGLIGQDEYHAEMAQIFAGLNAKYGDSVIYEPQGIENGQLMRFVREPFVKATLALSTAEEGHDLTVREFVDVNELGSAKAVVLTKGTGASEVLSGGAFVVDNCTDRDGIHAAFQTILHGDRDDIVQRFENMKYASHQNTGQHFLTRMIFKAQQGAMWRNVCNLEQDQDMAPEPVATVK
jgi:trehalose-6-phosphate synthase